MHIFRAYWKNAFLKQYEKFFNFLRQELCSNNLTDFRLKKGLEQLPAVREKFLEITDRFATVQAQNANVHIDFPLFQRIALPNNGGGNQDSRYKNPGYSHAPSDGGLASHRDSNIRPEDPGNT
jgi:hypothetical protein